MRERWLRMTSGVRETRPDSLHWGRPIIMRRPFSAPAVRRSAALALVFIVLGSSVALAQVPAAAEPPPPPPPIWTGSAGVGLAVTSGNTDTNNLNVSLKGTFDPGN